MIRPGNNTDLPIDIVAVTADRTLKAAENGFWFTNEGAPVSVVLTLPENAPRVSFTALSVFAIGMSFNRPAQGVFISFNGTYGTRVSTTTAGARCRVVAINEVEWIVVDAFPESAWTISGPSADDYSALLLAWREAVRALGGEPLTPTMIKYDQHIYSEDLFGLLDKTDEYFLTWKRPTETDAVAMVSLKQHLTVIKYNGLTTGNGQGYLTDGVAQWLNTGFVPTTHGAIMTGDDQRIAYLNTFEGEAQAVGAGVRDTSNRVLSLRPNVDGQVRAAFGDEIQDFPLVGERTAIGFTAASKTATSISAWRDGVPLGTVTGLTPTSARPGYSIFIGAQNNGGTPELFMPVSIPYLVLGKALTDAQEVIANRNMLRLASYHGATVAPDTGDDDA